MTGRRASWYEKRGQSPEEGVRTVFLAGDGIRGGSDVQRRRYVVTGQVQGVGFRPFVYRSARVCGLTGRVGNAPEGVIIEAQGEGSSLDAFERLFGTDAPPLARIVSFRIDPVPVIPGEDSFVIAASVGGDHHGHAVRVSPDVATCDLCLADMLDPGNRRYGYAFVNCTDCGPRYTITRSIPYDRPFTSMGCFPLCEDCRREYEDPLDRRFHAQPNACPVCGPEIWLETADGVVRGGASVVALLEALAGGRIAAIKGLGGFHLACDALDPAAVRELRRRKNRPHKALAVMVADIGAARRVARVSREAEAALTSPRRPVVICPRLPGKLPAILAPDTADIGLMLPCTPLHHLLFHPEASGGRPDLAPKALVMTSGNAGGDPICLGNREARKRLDGIADVFLFHNRDILVRVDDSVLAPGAGASFPDNEREDGARPAILIRRARGFAPEPLGLPALPGGAENPPCVFAAGAQLKHTFCLTRGAEAFVSQHIGDLERPAALDFFTETLRHLSGLLEVEPAVVVRDLHPDYPSSRIAEEFGRARGLPVLTLQHHVAHVFAVLAEHASAFGSPALGLALDGSGLGEDGAIWGGELLWVDAATARHRRLGRLTPFFLPGGEAAVREPWRTAEGLWRLAGLPAEADRPWSRAFGAAVPLVGEMLNRGIRCLSTTSCGRLFDAVAALCGLCFAVTYEGQAALLLEGAQDRADSGAYPASVREAEDADLLELDSRVLFRAAAEDRLRGVSPARVARRFHRGLSEGLADWALAGAEATGTRAVVLAGGVMNNRTLAAELPAALRARGLTPLMARAFPPGDGGIALGQAVWARCLPASGPSSA